MTKNQLQNIKSKIKELDLVIKLTDIPTPEQELEITKLILQILNNL